MFEHRWDFFFLPNSTLYNLSFEIPEYMPTITSRRFALSVQFLVPDQTLFQYLQFAIFILEGRLI